MKKKKKRGAAAVLLDCLPPACGSPELLGALSSSSPARMEEDTKTDHEAQGEDLISELADDLVFQFLHRLDMKSAAQTSVLSKRWRYVWTNWTDLDFDPWRIIPEYDMWESPSESMRARYLKWVSQVVNSHHGPSVDRFKILFPFDARYSSHIDAWVKFAVAKKVKELQLDFFGCEFFPRYRLGRDLLADGGLSFLTSLHLSKANVSEEFLEDFILRQCPLLEQLFVSDSEDLVGFKLMDSCCKCKLKRLGIHGCPNLEMVKIHSDSLEYFDFSDALRHGAQYIMIPTLLELDCVPSLIDASFGGQCCEPYLIHETITLVSKLQVSMLTVRFETSDLKYYHVYGLNLPSLRNIKNLTMMIRCDSEYLEWAFVVPCFIEACPVLSELKIQVHWSIFKYEEARKAGYLLELEGEDLKACQDELIKEMDTHPSLRVFELVGFLGIRLDVLLLLFIALRAFNLKTIICDPRCYVNGSYAVEDDVLVSAKETSRQRASKLALALSSLSSGLSVVIR